MPVTRVCETCGKPFSVKPYRSKDGRGKYCSDICKGKGLSGKNNPNYQGKSITDYQKQKRKEQIGTNAPGYGKHPSEETRQKMSLSQKGKPHILHSEETRKKIGDKKRGIPQCDETRRKISESKKGKPLSEETRRKMF